MVINIGGKSFSGFISTGGRKYALEITVPENCLESTSLKVDWRLKRQLGNSLNKFLEGNKFSDPRQLYCELDTFVKNNLKANKETEMWLQHPLKTAALLKSLQHEIIKAKNYVKDFDIESGLVNIEINDIQSRTHRAVLKLSQNYKIQPITVLNHDLPLQKTGIFECTSYLDNIFSVAEFCEKFSELITVFQQFWNMTAIIDSQCCILDPVNPTFKDVFRRIKLSDTLSVVLTFNPFCCSQMPSIKLLGCQSDVIYHQTILHKNLENELWDPEEDLLFNLSNVLETSIPNKIYSEELGAEDLADSEECAICFTSTLENAVPSEMCENTKCKSAYHSKCLFTYLSSIPRNRDYFGKIQGECPNCEDIIFCTVPKLM